MFTPLALAAGQLVRIALGKARRLQSHAFEQVARRRSAALRRHAMHPRPKAIDSSMVRRGLSEE